MNNVTILEGDLENFGGYSVNGQEFRSEEAEMLVDEAREMAFATRRNVEEVLATIIPG